MSVRVPVSDIDVLPLRAMTTPVFAATGTKGRPDVPLPYNWSKPEGPRSVSASGGARMAPVPSLMKIAAADCGSGLGTAIGRTPFDELCWTTDTRACALILATIPPKPMNHGRSVSVALMSMYLAAQGDPFGSLLSPAPVSPKYPEELIRMCILEAGVPPTCSLYSASAPLASGPAYLCA